VPAGRAREPLERVPPERLQDDEFGARDRPPVAGVPGGARRPRELDVTGPPVADLELDDERRWGEAERADLRERSPKRLDLPLQRFDRGPPGARCGVVRRYSDEGYEHAVERRQGTDFEAEWVRAAIGRLRCGCPLQSEHDEPA
jgi:hypothetical protein